MYRFNIGQALIIHDSLKGRADWYTDDIYYVIKRHPKGFLKNTTNQSGYDESGFNINDLIEVETLSGINLIAHESKFIIAPKNIVREEKLNELLND